jgi:hypothetical protein
MNANELADWLETIEGYPAIQAWGNKLRQQQERITQLEKLLEHSVGADCREMRYIQEIENKDAEIEALKNQVLGDDYVFVCKRCGEEMGINYEQ